MCVCVVVGRGEVTALSKEVGNVWFPGVVGDSHFVFCLIHNSDCIFDEAKYSQIGYRAIRVRNGFSRVLLTICIYIYMFICVGDRQLKRNDRRQRERKSTTRTVCLCVCRRETAFRLTHRIAVGGRTLKTIVQSQPFFS